MLSQARERYEPKRLNLSLCWFFITQTIATVTGWAIVSGEQIFRAFGLGAVTLGMLLPLAASLEAGLMAMIVFEPFRGFLRRAQYLIVPYSQSEPIHLITPVITFFAFLIVLQRKKTALFYRTPLALPVTILAFICFLHVFNPLQGSLFVGFTGAMYYLVPMAWFYFGQETKPEFFPKMMRLVVVLGIICSLWGVYQMVVGYPAFELYWIENTDHYESIAVYNVKRALATFSNAEEWGRYVLLGSLVAFGLGMSKTEGAKRPIWFACAVTLCGMLALTGQRSSIFGLFLGLIVLFMTGAKTLGSAVSRVLLLCIPFVLVLVLSGSVADDGAADLDEGDGINTMITHTKKGTVNPAGEGSLEVRFETWTDIVTNILPSNPVGAGLGASTLSASRETSKDRPVDNHFLSLAVSAGVPAALLLIWILFRAFGICIRLWRESEADSVEFSNWRIAMALLSSYILNNFFGTSFVIYSVAPLGWLLLGWISAAYQNRER
jgi:hypothetical protein